MHYFSPFHKTIETAIYRKLVEGQEYRFDWYPASCVNKTIFLFRKFARILYRKCNYFLFLGGGKKIAYFNLQYTTPKLPTLLIRHPLQQVDKGVQNLFLGGTEMWAVSSLTSFGMKILYLDLKQTEKKKLPPKTLLTSKILKTIT